MGITTVERWARPEESNPIPLKCRTRALAGTNSEWSPKQKGQKPHPKKEAVKKRLPVRFLKFSGDWLCSAHEPGKFEQPAAFDSVREPAADELARSGRGAAG